MLSRASRVKPHCLASGFRGFSPTNWMLRDAQLRNAECFTPNPVMKPYRRAATSLLGALQDSIDTALDWCDDAVPPRPAAMNAEVTFQSIVHELPLSFQRL